MHYFPPCVFVCITMKCQCDQWLCCVFSQQIVMNLFTAIYCPLLKKKKKKYEFKLKPARRHKHYCMYVYNDNKVSFDLKRISTLHNFSEVSCTKCFIQSHKQTLILYFLLKCSIGH